MCVRAWLGTGRGLAPEEHDVRLRSVDSIVYPATALLYSQLPPLILQRQPIVM